MPLSMYTSGSYVPPKGSYVPENDFIPVNKVLTMTRQSSDNDSERIF